VARTLGTANVALMRGHGNVCVAHNLMTAVYRAIYTEVNARLQLNAIALGSAVTYLDRGECAIINARTDTHVHRPWELWKRRVERG